MIQMTVFWTVMLIVAVGICLPLAFARERRSKGNKADPPGQPRRWKRPPLGLQLHLIQLNKKVDRPRPLEFRRKG